MRKSQITPERKQRKKRFFNSICTPPEHPDSPQNLYLWAFSQFSPLLKLGKSKDILKYICLSFISFLPLFYLCYIYYFGSLIFCCQFVANFIITGRKTFDKYCLFYILASLYALSSSLSLNILYIHSGIA